MDNSQIGINNNNKEEKDNNQIQQQQEEEEEANSENQQQEDSEKQLQQEEQQLLKENSEEQLEQEEENNDNIQQLDQNGKKKKKKVKFSKNTNFNTSSKKQILSRSIKAGLQFPVGRIARYLKREIKNDMRLSATAPIYLAAVIEYLCAEILELAGNCALSHKLKRITPRHVMLAIKSDEELYKLTKNTWICNAGIVPGIHSALLVVSKKKNIINE